MNNELQDTIDYLKNYAVFDEVDAYLDDLKKGGLKNENSLLSYLSDVGDKMPYGYLVNPSTALLSSKDVFDKCDDVRKSKLTFFLRRHNILYFFIEKMLKDIMKVYRKKVYLKIYLLVILSFSLAIISGNGNLFLIALVVATGAYLFKKSRVSKARKVIDKLILITRSRLKRSESYSSEEIVKQVDSYINDVILKKAREACSSVSPDAKPEILTQMALIQQDSLSGYRKVSSKNYFKSFWVDIVDGSYVIIPAIYYVKIIFILDDKVEIYSTFYDFIENETVGRDINSFYFKDITQVSITDLTRSIDDDGVGATFFEIAITSGDKVGFTLFNKDTVNDINEAVGSDENYENNINKEIENLEKQKETSNNPEEIALYEKEIGEYKENLKNQTQAGETIIKELESIQVFSNLLKEKIRSSKVSELKME